MPNRKKGGQSGKKGGSVIDQTLDAPNKPKKANKKPKKGSKGK